LGAEEPGCGAGEGFFDGAIQGWPLPGQKEGAS
jgi:hypothetical protein